MDEAKKKYLEELRKQVDPEILSKMANYLGKGDEVGNASIGGALANQGQPITSLDSKADLMRDRRAQQFKERVAARKRASLGGDTSQEDKKPVEERTIHILSSTAIWSRIINNQFRKLGFTGALVFAEFELLIRHIIENLQDGMKEKFTVAVALKEIRHFLLSWEGLKKSIAEQNKDSFLDSIVFFLVVESLKQIQGQLIQIVGVDRIINLSDELVLNKEKIERELRIVES